MEIYDVQTVQSGIKNNDATASAMLNYSLFLGGLNASANAIKQYDPLRTGYNRIFFLKMPRFMEVLMPEKTKAFRHLLEYGFTKIDGIGNTSLETESITGGYAGRSFDVATTAKDETSSINIGLYEFAGSPVREYLDTWITGISDPYTGLGHYHGLLDAGVARDKGAEGIKYSQHNHIAEAIYVATDPTGRSDGIEYACLLTNMMPKTVKKDHFNYESGQHGIVQVDVEFTCVKYESAQINQVAIGLISKYQTIKDYLDFKSEYDPNNPDPGKTVPDFYNWAEKKPSSTANDKFKRSEFDKNDVNKNKYKTFNEKY